MPEPTTEKRTLQPDEEALELEAQGDSDQEANEKIVALWKERFKRAEDFRRPYIARNLRMYKLYRAYRAASNYAYGTSLMPPTGFEIVETVKPRLASAEIKVNIYPTKKEDVGKKDNIAHWDDLIQYDLQVMEFDDKKILWIDAMLMFGNGTAQLMWDGDENGDPYMEIVDNWLFYPDPQSMNRLKNSRWEIKQSFKSKAIIEKEEEKRGDNALYDKITLDQWKELKDGGIASGADGAGGDPRRERQEVNTLKMGQIDDGSQRGQAVDSQRGETEQDRNTGEAAVEIWECFDHVTNKLQVIFNRAVLARDDENPYLKVNKGQVFIDLADISLPWEYYAMSHLEPVETTIHEIADSRNQAMDDIVFSLDPIRKVKKGLGYKDSDFKHSPGAVWFLTNVNDVDIVRPPEVSRAWIEKDNILRREIESSLAMSEYVRGIPKSGTEPASKVEMLLMQTNIRFSLLVRQMEIAFTEVVNALIDMNQEFLGEAKSFRLLGKDFKFADFTQEDKEVVVDARVDITPKKEKSPEQESNEVLEMYKLFVVDDKPEPGDEEEVEAWRKKKQLLQKEIAMKFGYEAFADVLAPEIKKKKKEPETEVPPRKPQAPPGPIAPLPPEGIGGNEAVVPEQLLGGGENPAVPAEAFIPAASTAATAPPPGFLQALLARARGRR